MSQRTLGERGTYHRGTVRNIFPRRKENNLSEHDPISRRANTEACPLSFAQERIWLLNQLNPGSHLHRQFGVRLRGELCIPLLEQTLGTVLRRHEVLRANFHAKKGVPRQSASPDCSIQLPVVDLSDWPEGQRQAVASRLAAQAGAQPFDLQAGPLLRAKLLRLGAEDHVLVLTVHQIAMDRRSKAVLLEELLRLYSGEQLPELAVQFGDFAVWQRNRVKGRLFSRELRYWKRQLEGSPVLLELPADRPRPAVRSYRGARVPIEISPELTAKLRLLGQGEECTLFTTLLAAYQTLIHRYTGSDDIVMGAPVANRNRPELEGNIGCFANMLALRTRIPGDATFRELLARVHKGARGANAHQDLPFEKLLEKLEVSRDPSFAPLFQLLFEFEEVVPSAGQPGSLIVTPLDVQGASTEFDLTLHVEETGQGMAGWFEFATDLFDRCTIERLAGHFATLLAGIVANPEQRLSRLPLLTAEERAWQRAHFDRTVVMLPPAVCVHELIREQAVISPGAVAVECEGQKVTYAELDLRSERLAKVLSSLDIGTNDIVAFCVDRSPEMVVALLGILKTGAAYLPLDPDIPEERLVQILRDARPRALLTVSGATQNLSSYSKEPGDLGTGLEMPLIYLDAEVWDGMEYENVRRPRSCAGPEDLAYVIYTSRADGHPKGVQIPHRALGNLMDSVQEQLEVSGKDTLLALTGISCDMAGLELLLPLTVGGRVVIAGDSALSDAARLAQLVEKVRPTIMQAGPTTWRWLLEVGWQGHGGLKILCGGEPWSEDLAEQLLRRGGALWNMYGPTETTVWSAVSKVEPGQPVYIGRPIANTSFHILDPHQQPVPVGVPGELYIGGDGVALGYLGQPELTARCFLPDPFRPGANALLYRTGDRVRYTAAGGIEFLGRMDSHTRIHGFRVEPGGIETVLRSHPAVDEAVVVVREDLSEGQRLVAYIVPSRGRMVGSDDLRKFLRHTLPEYMVPSAIVSLDLLPTTFNGKTDRNALPAPERLPGSGREKPRSELEKMIQEIWQEVLGITRVELNDDFFDLGGHSLLVVQMHQLLREKLGREVPIVSLFQYTTVSRLSDFLSGWGHPSNFVSVKLAERCA